MQLTKQSEYALQGLAFLAAADPNRAVPLAEIAEAQRLPASFLAKIFQKLVRHGILVAARGRGSGYHLSRDPTALRIRDIFEAIEGPGVFERCQFWQGHCSDANPCPLHEWFKHLKPAFAAQLDSITLWEYLRRKEERREPAWSA